MLRQFVRFFVKPSIVLAYRILTHIASEIPWSNWARTSVKPPEQFKAWSQNLGREKVLTTFLSYGEVACQCQGEIIRNLAPPQKGL